MTAQKELKPCPFCGGVAGLRVSGSNHARAIVSVDCNRCGAHGPVAQARQSFARRPFSEENRAIWDAEALATESLAIELWNERRPR